MAEMEMLERAAKAHYERLHYTRWENLTPSTRAGFLAAMRAAIEAMREPTEEMCDAGADRLDTNDPADRCPGPNDMERAWQTMIDAILSNTKEG